MRASFLQPAVVFLSLLIPTFAPAQGSADADTREVLAYRLTMPKLRQLNQAMTEMKRLEQADPKFQELQKKKAEAARLAEKDDLTDAETERLAKLEEEIAAAEEGEEQDDPEDPQSLSRMADKMAADPRVAGALRSAGLTPREAAVMMIAFMQAALAGELMESQGITEIPPGVSAENVRFYRENKAELVKLTALADKEQ
jgi:hypothetical protein